MIAQADLDARAAFDPDVFVAGAPYDALARLRREAPVHRVELPSLPPVWLVTRYADVATVSKDDERFSSATGNTLIEVVAGTDSAMLPSLDPPRHTQVRRLINSAFTARNVARLEDRVRTIAARIVDRVIEEASFDAVETISAEISLQVIAEVLGAPVEDRLDLFRWSNAIGSLGIEDPDYAPSPDALGRAAADLCGYFAALVTERRAAAPRDDILSGLLAAEIDGEGLNDNQLNEFFLLLAVAGNETTRNTISHGILALSDHPDQRRLLAGDPGVITSAVEELLRWSTPVLHFRRTVTRDTELGGQRLLAGDWVVMHYLSANRDETVFEAPDRFDLSRQVGSHAAFGGLGTHFCLGAQLARLELRVMLEELYTRVPMLTVTAEPVRLRSAFFHGIKHLPCSTSAA